MCGYSEVNQALAFHHLDPSQKEFSISSKTKSSGRISWGRIKRELDKCVLLCSNCHAGVHAGAIDLDGFLSAAISSSDGDLAVNAAGLGFHTSDLVVCTASLPDGSLVDYAVFSGNSESSFLLGVCRELNLAIK